MERFVRLLSSLIAGLIVIAVPAPSLARGFGLGLGIHHNSSVTLSQSGSTTEDDDDDDDDVKVEVKAENRCKKLSGDDRTRCLALVKLQMSARGDKDSRALHGTFMSALRHRIHDIREDGRDIFARVRVFLSDFRTQLRTALNTEAELALKVCMDKEGDDQEACVADAKLKLQAKVNAAIEAMKK